MTIIVHEDDHLHKASQAPTRNTAVNVDVAIAYRHSFAWQPHDPFHSQLTRG